MSIWLLSDTHFNHDAIRRYCNRPFDTVEAMNAAIIERWNARVRANDEIYLLGDFAFCHSKLTPVADIFAQLNGRKHLIVGNHDEKNPAVMKLPWLTIDRLRTLKWEGTRAQLCHYPLESWSGAHHGALMLHGHCHGSLKRKVAHRFDVGFDVYPDGPVALSTLVAMAAKQTFRASDHHGDL